MGYEKKDVVIFIGDDAKFTQRVLKDALVAEGYTNILAAYSGSDVLELFKVSSPDVVLLDINMPDGDGISTLIKIRERSPKTICIIVSVLNQEVIMEKAIKHGAFRYITKPFKKEQVVQAVNDALASKYGS